MNVVYYTSTYFLDISVEVINVLKKHVNLHVFIEITPSSKNTTIADVETLPAGKKLVPPAELLSPESLSRLEPYLQGTASAYFVVHEHSSGLSLSTLQASVAVWQYARRFKPDIIHFEGFTLRTMGMLPFLFGYKKVFFTIHDPVPHSGEQSWKISVPYFSMFNIPVNKCFIFYSQFARQQFINHYPKVKSPKILIGLRPYSYYKSLAQPEGVQNKHILFFGRISPYKGADILLKAMPLVLQQFPQEQLIIAGKTVSGYILSDDMPDACKSHITILNRYIPNDELMKLITEAKFVVCPYLDATQSGVLMTAFALNTPVIASRVGSFPEFVQDNYNGLLVEPGNVEALADSINHALQNNLYQVWRHNIASSQAENSWEHSIAALLQQYGLN